MKLPPRITQLSTNGSKRKNNTKKSLRKKLKPKKTERHSSPGLRNSLGCSRNTPLPARWIQRPFPPPAAPSKRPSTRSAVQVQRLPTSTITNRANNRPAWRCGLGLGPPHCKRQPFRRIGNIIALDKDPVHNRDPHRGDRRLGDHRTGSTGSNSDDDPLASLEDA